MKQFDMGGKGANIIEISPCVFIFYYLLHDQCTSWTACVTAVHDDINASI